MSKRQYKNLLTPPFVVSYPEIWTPQKSDTFKTDKTKYGCQAIWTPGNFGPADKKLWAAIHAEIVDAVKAKFEVTGSTRSEVEAALREKYETAKMGLRDGGKGTQRDKKGYGPGTWFASLTTGTIPGVVDRDCNPISPEHGNTNLIFPGVVCRAAISIYAYDKSGGRGYAFGLGSLQYIKKGPRLDNRQEASKVFAGVDLDEAWLDQDDALELEEETFES